MSPEEIFGALVEASDKTPKSLHGIKRYVKFIIDCQAHNTDLQYFEKHHILPRSVWPQFARLGVNKWNRADLTARQHYIAHTILAKCLGGAMWNALFMMTVNSSSQSRDYKITSRAYQLMKEECAKQTSLRFAGVPKSEEHRMKISATLTGLPRHETTEETRKKISASVSGELNGFYGRSHSEETKQKLRDAMTGRTVSEETKQKLRDAMTGRTVSEETRQKISEANTGKMHTEETKKVMSEKAKARTNPNGMSGRKHSEEAKAIMSEKRRARGYTHEFTDEEREKIRQSKLGKPRKKVTCPHCNKEGGDGIMQRWHFDNCKKKGA